MASTASTRDDGADLPECGTSATIRIIVGMDPARSVPQTEQRTASPGVPARRTRIHPAPSATSPVTSGGSPENTVLTSWPTSRTAHREASRHAVTTERAAEPI